VKVLLINASAPSYNLGMAKAANYWRAAGADVTEAASVPTLYLQSEGFDLVWISAIFSWDVAGQRKVAGRSIPSAIQMAQEVLSLGVDVGIGGPGTFGLRDYIFNETGLRAQATPDSRFERQPGNYKAVFWSRGCPAKNCSLGFPRDGGLPVCSVPEMEGWRFTLYDDVTPASVILDNNLSALPISHQELIVERTLAAGFKIIDAQEGFEPRSFKPSTAQRWRRLPLKAWRLLQLIYFESLSH
jgi:hypothetical protein